MKSLTHFHFSKHGAFARRFAFAPLVAIFTALAPTAVVFAADGPIAAVQEALVKQQLLAGEPSGVLDESTRAALRTFQTRHDLPATGEIDTATLEALQKPTETSSSATESRRKENVVAVLAQTTAESDREFLREVESGRAETGASENSTTTEAPAKTVSPSEQPRVVLPHGENPRRELPEIRCHRSGN
jgi:peptidoglycan hydrolase-like protein with peptidoglycan-binding domain